VELECRSQTDYYGSVYVGSRQELSRIIFDTTVAWTSINLSDAKGQGIEIFSDYNLSQSETAELAADANGDPKEQIFEWHGASLISHVYRDDMCLI